MVKQTNSNHGPTHEEIAKVAYAIFEKNGRIPGRDKENWFEAEMQLAAAARKATAGRPAAPTASRATQRAEVNH